MEKQNYTLKDLREGKVYIINDSSIEDLNFVLKVVTGSDFTSAGQFNYYTGNPLVPISWGYSYTIPNKPVVSTKYFIDLIRNMINYKYKLVKTFPGSAKLGSIFYFIEDSCVYKTKDEDIFEGNPGDYPEFFQIVNPPTYQVKELLNDTIVSVRRVSDGEVFSVGEKTNAGVIAKFKITSDDRMIVDFTNTQACYLDSKSSPIIKDKALTYSCRDKTPIYKGDNVTLVSRSTGIPFALLNVSERSLENCPVDKYCWCKSDKELNKSVMMYKPVLNLKEIGDIYVSAQQYNKDRDNHQGRRIWDAILDKLNLTYKDIEDE